MIIAKEIIEGYEMNFILTEEDVKGMIVEPLLNQLGMQYGFGKGCYRREYRLSGLKPIDYYCVCADGFEFIIESKAPGKIKMDDVWTNNYSAEELHSKEFDQLVDYLNGYDIKYGILTNGAKWIFIDNERKRWQSYFVGEKTGVYQGIVSLNSIIGTESYFALAKDYVGTDILPTLKTFICGNLPINNPFSDLSGCAKKETSAKVKRVFHDQECVVPVGIDNCVFDVKSNVKTKDGEFWSVTWIFENLFIGKAGVCDSKKNQPNRGNRFIETDDFFIELKNDDLGGKNPYYTDFESHFVRFVVSNYIMTTSLEVKRCGDIRLLKVEEFESLGFSFEKADTHFYGTGWQPVPKKIRNLK